MSTDCIQEKCPRCLGRGVLYVNWGGQGFPILCQVCGGTCFVYVTKKIQRQEE